MDINNEIGRGRAALNITRLFVARVGRCRRIILSWAIALACCSPVGAQSLQQPGFTAYINGNSTALTFAPVSFDSSGANTVITGVSGKVIRVYRMSLGRQRERHCYNSGRQRRANWWNGTGGKRATNFRL